MPLCDNKETNDVIIIRTKETKVNEFQRKRWEKFTCKTKCNPDIAVGFAKREAAP